MTTPVVRCPVEEPVNALQVRGVSHSFGRSRALTEVSLGRRGEAGGGR